jgi:hypothetical protein
MNVPDYRLGRLSQWQHLIARGVFRIIHNVGSDLRLRVIDNVPVLAPEVAEAAARALPGIKLVPAVIEIAVDMQVRFARSVAKYRLPDHYSGPDELLELIDQYRVDPPDETWYAIGGAEVRPVAEIPPLDGLSWFVGDFPDPYLPNLRGFGWNVDVRRVLACGVALCPPKGVVTDPKLYDALQTYLHPRAVGAAVVSLPESLCMSPEPPPRNGSDFEGSIGVPV